MSSKFDPVFARLREVLAKHSAGLAVSEDAPGRYCLSGGLHPKHKQPMAIAWVEVGKAYVSYHLMPVYGYPKLLDNYSKALKARMQGKSCFNFKAVDDGLFEELDRLTAQSLAVFAKAGYLPEREPA
jgi:hypothetical protein